MNDAADLPARIGPYRVVRAVAEGGMARVYEVADPATGRAFAAKVLSDRTGSMPRFGREYRALTTLDHPNVVRVYRYGLTDGGAPYLVMELLQGVPAQVRVKSVGRPGDAARTAEAVRIGAGVARALEYCHARGIVHRDLKSSNVLVLGDGQVKVLDFGTARLLNAFEHLTEPGEFVGTFHYASPEQLTGAPVGAAADLYALGVLLYRLLTGRRPFEGENPNVLARMHLEVTPPAPSQVVPAIPGDVSDLVMHLLAKAPEARPASASEVVARLPLAPDASRPAAALSLRAIGRQAQLEAVQALLDAPTPAGALLFTGPEGSGRSRLVAMALEEAQHRGLRTVRLAFGSRRRPFADLAARVLPTFAELDDAGGPAAAQRLLAADRPRPEDVATLLLARAVSDARPFVVGADDLERGGRREIECLFAAFESLHGAHANVLLVGSWREGPVPRSWPGARTVAVPPLSGEEVGVLASQALGVSSVSPALVRRLLAASGGMPQPVEALVRAMPRDPEAALVVPDDVRERVLLRLESLGPVERRAAEAVALAEGDLDAGQIGWAVDEPPEAVQAALDALVGEDLLVEQDGRWAFRMGLAGELVRGRTRNTRRHVLCRRVADAVLGAPPSPRIAAVLLEAGRPADAAACAVAWGEPLVRAGMHAEALPGLRRLAVEGADAAGGPFLRLLAECLAEAKPRDPLADDAVARLRAMAAGPAETGEAELAAARLARARGEPDVEREGLRRAVAAFAEAGLDARAAVARTRMAEVARAVGALAEARTHAEVAAAAADGPEAVHASAALAEALVELGELRAAESAAQETLRAEAALGQPGLRGAAVLAAALREQGRFTEARVRVEAALPIARTQASPLAYGRLLLAAARLDLDLFRVALARERMGEAQDVLAGGTPAPLDAPLASLRAALAAHAGEGDIALALLTEAEGRCGARGQALWGARLRGQRGALLARAGRVAEGRVEMAAARDALARMGALPALAELAAARADVLPEEEPDGVFAEVLQWMEMQPARIARLEYLLAAARHARAGGDRARATMLRGRAEALLGQLRRLLQPEDGDALLVHPWAVGLG